MRLQPIILFITALISCTSQKQSPKKEIYNKDFDWTITIPENFDTVSAQQWEEMQNKGKKAIEKTYDQKVENNAKTIFVFKNGQLNYFESNYQPFDSTIEGSYMESFRNVNNMLYGTFQAQMPNTQLDSVSSNKLISGLMFQTFKGIPPVNYIFAKLTYADIFAFKKSCVKIILKREAKCSPTSPPGKRVG